MASEELPNLGATLFDIENSRLAEFEAEIIVMIKTQAGRFAEMKACETIKNKGRTISELRSIKKASNKLATEVLKASQQTMDVLGSTFSIADADDYAEPLDFKEAVVYLHMLSQVALKRVTTPKRYRQRGRPVTPPLGSYNAPPLDELIAGVCRAVIRCGGRWRADKDDKDNSAVVFLRSLESHLPADFLRHLNARRVNRIGCQISATFPTRSRH